MSYVPGPPTGPPEDPPGGSPGPPEPQRKGRTGPILLGALVAVVATVLGPMSALVFGDALGALGLGLLSPLAILVLGVVLLFFPGTRPWGVGLLIGFFAMLIIGAGACVLLLMSLDASYGAAL